MSTKRDKMKGDYHGYLKFVYVLDEINFVQNGTSVLIASDAGADEKLKINE